MNKPQYSTVMIIDDSGLDLLLLKHTLQSINYADNLLAYDNPLEAFEYFKNNHSGKTPEIIFLDLNMPGMDGFQFMNAFKSLPENLIAGIKFIILTSSDDKENIEKATSYPNVIQYLIKPLKRIDLDAIEKGKLIFV
jgi:response regulator RpfG family c-di-GMP phosphodiesterase